MSELNINIANNINHNLVDLPNEILLMIFNKLNMVDALYSLVDITERFDRLLFDPFYVRHLDLTSLTMKSFYNRTYTIDNELIDRIC